MRRRLFQLHRSRHRRFFRCQRSSNRDFMLVANGVLIISIFVAICNLVVDILYGIIDPRTR